MDKTRIKITVARNMEDMVAAFAVRAVVYLGEAKWTYSEERDGNDFTATHLLAWVDDEPVGTLRIRYFGEFAKPERMAILPAYRSQRFGQKGVAMALGSYAFLFCRQKGFRRFYGHALKDLVKFWARFGDGKFRPIDDQQLDCGGKVVQPMSGEFPPLNDAIHLPCPGAAPTEHFRILREEGKWDEPGFWETSSG